MRMNVGVIIYARVLQYSKVHPKRQCLTGDWFNRSKSKASITNRSLLVLGF